MAKGRGLFTIYDMNDPIVSGVEPNPKFENMLWLDTSKVPNQLKRWENGKWVLGTPTKPEDVGSVPSGTYEEDKIATEEKFTQYDEEFRKVEGELSSKMSSTEFTERIEETFGVWKATYRVSTSKPMILKESDGISDLNPSCTYAVSGFIPNTNTGALVSFVGNGSRFTIEKIKENGTTSNHIEFYLNLDGRPAIRLYNQENLYNIEVKFEKFSDNIDIINILNKTQSEFKQEIGSISQKVSEVEQSEKTARNVTSFRYIRDWLNGNTTNSRNRWVELQVIVGEKNIALGLQPKSNNVITNPGAFTDGVVDNNNYTSVPSGTWEYLELDLGSEIDIDVIKTWHYFSDRRSYKHKLTVSRNGIEWYELFNSEKHGEYKETESGRTYVINESYTENRIKNAEQKITPDAIISTVSATIDKTVKEKVDEIEIGTRNYVKGTATKRLIEGTNITNQTVNLGEFSTIEPLIDKKVTTSFKFKVLSEECSGSFKLQTANGTYYTLTDTVHLKLGAEQKVTKTVKLGVAKDYTYVGARFDNFVGTIEILELKIETGTKATDYSVAPEDIDSKIVDTEKVLNDNLDSAISDAQKDLLDNVSQNYATNDKFEKLNETVSSNMAQTSEDIEMKFETVSTDVKLVNGQLQEFQSTVSTHIRFSQFGIELGKLNNPFTAILDNEKLAFLQNGKEVASIGNHKMYITQAEIKESLRIGRPVVPSPGSEDEENGKVGLGLFSFIQSPNGNLSLKWSEK